MGPSFTPSVLPAHDELLFEEGKPMRARSFHILGNVWVTRAGYVAMPYHVLLVLSIVLRVRFPVAHSMRNLAGSADVIAKKTGM